MYLWNVQENAPGNQADRGTTDFNIWYSNSPSVAPSAADGNVHVRWPDGSKSQHSVPPSGESEIKQA
jgi:hypothetical protein